MTVRKVREVIETGCDIYVIVRHLKGEFQAYALKVTKKQAREMFAGVSETKEADAQLHDGYLIIG